MSFLTLPPRKMIKQNKKPCHTLASTLQSNKKRGKRKNQRNTCESEATNIAGKKGKRRGKKNYMGLASLLMTIND
uniref:Uncharacterized protein n=1 Tax=Nelumbo nucifera TaxID=4432 RepID=A0A822Y406_NELNU|nr:TPA_asm: hypothetical protein HUJ06_028470 [Nelumbo nucifera]